MESATCQPEFQMAEYFKIGEIKMPYITEEKPLLPLASEASRAASAAAFERFTATINNLTDDFLELVTASVCGNWDSPPHKWIGPNDGETISSSGSFSNAACGSVSYQYKGSTVPNHPIFTLTYVVPSLGPNHITWHADPGMQVKVSGDGMGWYPELTFDITLG